MRIVSIEKTIAKVAETCAIFETNQDIYEALKTTSYIYHVYIVKQNHKYAYRSQVEKGSE